MSSINDPSEQIQKITHKIGGKRGAIKKLEEGIYPFRYGIIRLRRDIRQQERTANDLEVALNNEPSSMQRVHIKQKFEDANAELSKQRKIVQPLEDRLLRWRREIKELEELRVSLQARLYQPKSPSKVEFPFFNRDEQRSDIRTARAQRSVVILDSPIGYGKTRIIDYLSKMEHDKCIYKVISFMDNRYCSTTGFLKGVLALLSEELPQNKTPRSSKRLSANAQESDTRETDSPTELFDMVTKLLTEIGEERSRNNGESTNILLVLEDVHRIRDLPFSNWLRDTFASQLRQRLILYRGKLAVNLVIIGRFINPTWRTLEGRVLRITLPRFDLELIKQIFKEIADNEGIPPIQDDLIESLAFEVYRLTGGHPKCVVELLNELISKKKLAVMLDREHPDYFFGKVNSPVLFDKYVRPILENVLNELPSDELRDAYEALSIFRCFFNGLPEKLQAAGFMKSHPRGLELTYQLEDAGYIELDGALYKEQVLRPIVALQVRNNSPEIFARLNDFAFDYWNTIILNNLKVNDDSLWACIQEALYHLLIKLAMEKQTYLFGCFEQNIADEIFDALNSQLKMYAGYLRSAMDDDLVFQKKRLKGRLKEDWELAWEVRYLLGPQYWKRLMALEL